METELNNKDIFINIAYDGTNYCGWQRQTNGLTVQGVVEHVLTGLCGHDVTLRGTSRTDAGVHALAQGAVFGAPELRIPIDKLPQVINGKLPKDVAVTNALYVPSGFNPQYAAKKKTYTYSILNSRYPNPLLANRIWHVSYPLCFDDMQTAAAQMCGEHDFKAFSATGSERKTSVRTVYESRVEKDGDIITYTVTGNGFLYNMVRIMAGTLVYVGEGKIKPDAIRSIIQSCDRKAAGITAPPQGLTLYHVDYDSDLNP